jgi:hypothetical protein
VVCLQPLAAQVTGAAKAMTLNGQVSVLRDNYPWALHVNESVRPGQIIVTGSDGYALFQLTDGSTFEVFPNSRTIFRESGGGWRDLLNLVIGRVKVHIEKVGGQPNPNSVRTPTAVISVRGTTFDVVVEEDEVTLVSVEEGTVAVQHASLPGKEKLLAPGEQIRVYKNQPLAKSTIDRGAAAQSALRAAAQALYELIYRTSRPTLGGTTTSGGSGAGLPGDKCKDGNCGDTGPTAPPPRP